MLFCIVSIGSVMVLFIFSIDDSSSFKVAHFPSTLRCFLLFDCLYSHFFSFYSCSDHSVASNNIHFGYDFTVPHNLPI